MDLIDGDTLGAKAEESNAYPCAKNNHHSSSVWTYCQFNIGNYF